VSRLHVEAETVVGAPPATVWALVSDARRYPEWGPWREGRCACPGGPELVFADWDERVPARDMWKTPERFHAR